MGFEPTTSFLARTCSIRLSYGGTVPHTLYAFLQSEKLACHGEFSPARALRGRERRNPGFGSFWQIPNSRGRA